MTLKRFITAIMMCFIVVIASAESGYKVTSPAPLNVREAATTNAEVIGTFESGTQIDVISIMEGWAKVKFNDRYGYVMAQYIEEVTLSSSAQDVYTEDSDFESQRTNGMYEITYSAGSFEDIKLSGSYGFSWTLLPWKIAPRLYAGIHFSPLNLNYGLSDFNYDEIRLGPAIGYYFTPKIFISIPLDVLCDVYFDDNDESKTIWGMSLAPSVYLGNKAGIFIGPQFTVGFDSESKVTCGFRAGIYF